MEWRLNPKIFAFICDKLGKPDIDLFASRLNFQIKPYMSWKPRPRGYCHRCSQWGLEPILLLCLPSFNMISKILQKIDLEGGTGILVVPKMGIRNHGGQIQTNVCSWPYYTLQKRRTNTEPPPPSGNRIAQDGPSSCSNIADRFKEEGITDGAIDVLLASWKPKTKTQYEVYIRKWNVFARENKVDCMQPYIANVLDFLNQLFHEGLSYSAINTARSSLSAFINLDGKPVGEHPRVTRFLKGVFNLRPAIPKNTTFGTLIPYSTTWNPYHQPKIWALNSYRKNVSHCCGCSLDKGDKLWNL